MSDNKPTNSPHDESIPPVDDDADDQPYAARQPAEQEEGEPRKARPQVAETADDDPRARAVQRYREIRDQEAAELAERQERHAEEQEQERSATDEGNDPAQTKDPQTPQRVKLKVMGREVEMTMEEALSRAQLYEASAMKYEEVKQLAAELKSAKGDPHERQERDAPRPRDESQRERLRRAAEALQVGDADEGAEALAQLMPDPADIDRRVEQRLRMSRVEDENNRALNKFAREFPELTQQNYLAAAGKEVLSDQIAAELRRAGVEEDIIGPLSRDPAKLTQAYNDLRAHGYQLRGPDAILADTGRVLKQTFRIGATGRSPEQDRIQDRIDRKRATPQQPRAAHVRQPMPTRPEPRTAKDIVGAMRKARGFSPTNR